MEVSVLNIKGQETGRKVALNEAIFGIEPNDHVIYLDVKQYMANQRQGTAKSKERSEISGSTRKLGRQKGGGGARHGDINSPLLIGGGRVFGPKPRDYGFKLNNKKIEELVQENIKQMNTKTPSSKTPIQSLSGGNQQKVLIGRWLANDPEVLILDEPTRGIDVGAKYEIYCIIADLAKQGKSIIMISSEMGELIGMSDRIMVMCDGRVTGFIDGKDATQENIMELATQFEA